MNYAIDGCYFRSMSHVSEGRRASQRYLVAIALNSAPFEHVKDSSFDFAVMNMFRTAVDSFSRPSCFFLPLK